MPNKLGKLEVLHLRHRTPRLESFEQELPLNLGTRGDDREKSRNCHMLYVIYREQELPLETCSGARETERPLAATGFITSFLLNSIGSDSGHALSDFDVIEIPSRSRSKDSEKGFE